MADEPEKTPVTNAYTQRLADALSANRQEQEDITAQIAGLQERMEQLKAHEPWLAQAVGSPPAAAAPAAAEAKTGAGQAAAAAAQAQQGAVENTAPAVPKPRADKAAKTVKAAQPKASAKKTAATGKAAAPAKKTAAKKTTAKKTAAKAPAAKKKAAEQAVAPETAVTEAPAKKPTAEEKPGPPLWKLILDILLKTPGQPCVVKEVSEQLAQDHPERATSIQTVRNNLETLVKKKLAEKSHQQGSAMYTAAAVSETDDTAGSGSAQAAEKVPAEV